jgi:hypothetical protein
MSFFFYSHDAKKIKRFGAKSFYLIKLKDVSTLHRWQAKHV